jgi:hypothetical protein
MLFIQVKNVRKLAMGNKPITACKQYCLAAGATQDNIAYTQTVMGKFMKRQSNGKRQTREPPFQKVFK